MDFGELAAAALPGTPLVGTLGEPGALDGGVPLGGVSFPFLAALVDGVADCFPILDPTFEPTFELLLDFGLANEGASSLAEAPPN